MSLPKDPIEPVPKETVRIAQVTFPRGNIYMKNRIRQQHPKRGNSTKTLKS